MAVSAEEIERRRLLAERSAQAVDPSDIEGLAPPPTSPVKSRKLETSFGPAGSTRTLNLKPPPPPQPSMSEIADGVMARRDPARKAEMTALADEAVARVDDRTAGRVETFFSEAGAGVSGMLESLPKAAIHGVIAERQGQGIASKIGLQPLANKLLGRELTDEELTRILPAIETNAASVAINKALDFNLGSNPDFMSHPDDDFEIGKFLNSTMPNALGSAAGFLMAGAITRGVGMGVGIGATGANIAGAVTASTLGAMSGGVDQAAGVAAKGGTNQQIIDAFVAGNLPGLTEGLPIGKALKRLDAASGGTFSRVMREGFKGSIEEAFQELIQGASSIAIENAILDLEQPLLARETAEGTAAGAVAGFLTSALLTAIGGRRAGQNKRTGPGERAEAATGGKPDDSDDGSPPGSPGAQGAPETDTDVDTPEREKLRAERLAADQPDPEKGDVDANKFFGTPEDESALPPIDPTGEAPEIAPDTPPEVARKFDVREIGLIRADIAKAKKAEALFAKRLKGRNGVSFKNYSEAEHKINTDLMVALDAELKEAEGLINPPDFTPPEEEVPLGPDGLPITPEAVPAAPAAPDGELAQLQAELAATFANAPQAQALPADDPVAVDINRLSKRIVELGGVEAMTGGALAATPDAGAASAQQSEVSPSPEAGTGTDVAPAVTPAPEPAVSTPQPLPEGVPEPEATTADLPTGASPESPTGTQEGRHTVQTAAGEQVETQFAVIPHTFLKASGDKGFTEALQPRERKDRQALQEQIKDIVEKFDPRRLGVAPTASTGAPIVNSRGEVISGNGRVAALREIFQNHPEQAQAYRDFVKNDLGIEIGAGEVLVQSVSQAMDAAQQRSLVDQANVSDTAELSSTEQARTDARGIDEAMLSGLKATEITHPGNQDFVNAFVSSMQARGENTSKLTQADGKLSADGRKRIENALLARALGAGDAQVQALRRTLENPENNTKNITAAILDSVSEMAGLQIAAENGNVAPEIAGQVAPALATAVDTMSQIRHQNTSVREFLAQQDILGPRPALVDEFIRSFMSPDLSRPASRANMARIFATFGTELTRTANTQQGDLLGAAPAAADPAAVLRKAREQVQADQGAPAQGGLFGGGTPPAATPPPAAPDAAPAAATGTPQIEGLPGTSPLGIPDQGAAATATAPAPAPDTPVPARPLASRATVKRASDFSESGEYVVTLPSGKTTRIFRDTEQFSSPIWHEIGNDTPAGIGSTQAEAISHLEQEDVANVEQSAQPAATNAEGLAGTEQQSQPATSTGASLGNSGATAPTQGNAIEPAATTAQVNPDAAPPQGEVSGQPHTDKAPDLPKTPENKSQPGTVKPGDQNVVLNQVKENYELVPMEEQAKIKAAIFGNDVLEQLDKKTILNSSLPDAHPNVNTVAIAFNKSLIQNRSLQLIGTTINTPADFAQIAQIYRDPQYETLRYIFLDKDNKVIYQTGVSQRLAGSVTPWPTGEHWQSWSSNLFTRMAENGAVRMFLQHNHPSGSAKPSSGDIGATKQLNKIVKRHGMSMEHVVINSNEYTLIKGNGTHQTIKEDFNPDGDALLSSPQGLEHDLIGVDLRHNKGIASAAKAIQTPNNVVLIGVASDRKVRAIGEMSWEKFKTLPRAKLQKEIENWRLLAGARFVVIGGIPLETVVFPEAKPRTGFLKSTALKKLSALGNRLHSDLTRSGIVQDFVDTNGNSAVVNRQFKKGARQSQNDSKVYQVFDDVVDLEDTAIDSEAVRRQRETVKNVRTGQPLDRLFRYMFTGFGVFEDRWLQTNKAGEDPTFRLGEAGLNKLSHFLQNTWFPTDSESGTATLEGRSAYSPGRIQNAAFVYGNRFLKRMRHGLIDRYALPDGVRELDELRFKQRLETITEGVEAAEKLIEMGADTIEEARLLQRFLTGEASEDTISDAEWRDAAVEVRASIDQLGMEAVNLGFVSRESYERNKGTWLHRTYYKHESFLSDGDSLQKWIGQTLRGPGRGVRGDAFKGRGIFLEHDQARLLRDVPKDLRDKLGFGDPKTKTTGKPDNSLLDSRWKIFDIISDPNATMLAPGIPAGTSPVKIKRRIIWPADTAIPEKFGNYEYRGDFIVRNVKGKKFTLWRDYIESEREQMGEILDGRYNIIKSFQMLSRDLANGRFFKSLADNPEWTWDPQVGGDSPPDGTIAPASTKLRDYFDYEWVEVPGTSVSGTGGKVKKWGALGGIKLPDGRNLPRFIRAEVWKDISEISEMNSAGPWKRLLTEWKLNKTARNPVVHMNNIVSNVILMDLLDIRTRDLVEGTMMRLAPIVLGNPKLKSLHGMFEKHSNPELLAEMRASGGFGHSLVDMELTGEVMDPIARELRSVMGQMQKDGGKNSLFASMRFLNVAAKLWTGQTELYRLEDEVFRTATIIRKVAQGYSMTEASKMGREQFLNYDIRAPWINAARRSVFPFISYTYRAVPALTEAIMRRPWKLAKYVVMAEVANAMAYAMSDGDEEFERGSLRKEVKGNISLGVFPAGVPRMLRLPSNDEFGRPTFLDIRRWVPAGDVFDLHNASPIPIPTWMHFSGPLMIAAEMALNRSAFTGQDIVDPLADDLGDKTLKFGSFLFQSYAPSAPYIYQSWYWNRIADAGKRTDIVGRTNTRTQAVLQSIGIKASSQDPELGYTYMAREFEATARAIKGQFNKAGRDFQRNIINEAGWKEAQETFAEKMGHLEKLRQETFAPYLNRNNELPPTEFDE